MANVPPEVKQFRCSYCPKSFGRAEHRKRHELIHTERRLYQCRSCSKDFIRRDALQRHELTHTATPNLLQRGGRACTQCAGAKAKCSGDIPCSRCRERDSSCTFPSVSAPNHAGPVHSSSTSTMPIIQTPMTPHDQMADSGLVDFNFWDSNVLAATNWLSALDENGFPEFPMSIPLDDSLFSPVDSSISVGPGVGSTSLDQVRAQVSTNSPLSTFSTGSIAHTEGNTSHASHDEPKTETGQYYVDGEVARLPRVKRRKLSQAQPTSNVHVNDGYSLQMRPLTAAPEPSPFVIKPEVYSAIVTSYQRFCIDPLPGSTTYERVEFPTVDILASLLGLYQKHFAPTLPCLHHIAFETMEDQDIIVLAMAAIGTHYLGESGSQQLTTSMHEFTRRLLVDRAEIHSEIYPTNRSCAYAQLLQLVGMAYSGNAALLKHADISRHWLSRIFSAAQQTVKQKKRQLAHHEDHQDDWRAWVRHESAIRVAYSAWMVDCMFEYFFQMPHMLNLSYIQVPLPCDDRHWNARSEIEWKEQIAQPCNPTLNEALQELYVEKRLPKERGEFARVIILQGLYHRTWEVGHYLSNPLSHWEPTASCQSSSEAIPSRPVWLPSIAGFIKWQNSACDCLDVLHWQANSTIGQARGLEHPTVLHLHLARTILLVPHAEITNLAKAMISPHANRNADEMQLNKRMIQRWTIQHQYKARLAIIHAGALFWHVRRYSVDGFYEAPAVALAALTLWAFGTFSNKDILSRATSQQPQSNLQSANDSEQSDDASSSIILLDRPADDEIVQQFIRIGHTMKAHVAGSDLYSPKGPERALRQGCKLLASQRCWGVASTWERLLQDLVRIVQKPKT